MLNRKKMITSLLEEAQKIRTELHDDVTALIYTHDMRELAEMVADLGESEIEIESKLKEAGLVHHIIREET